MSNVADKVAKLHALMDKTLLRVLALILGFMHVGLVMWDPNAYHREIGGFNAFIAPALIWACCSSMVYGVGFKPRNWYWQVLFSPYFSFAILIYLTALYFI